LERLDKYTIQTLGIALIVVGIFLFMLGLIGGPELSTYCPANGCLPVSLPWYWWVPTASFFFWYYACCGWNHPACRSQTHETRAIDKPRFAQIPASGLNRELDHFLKFFRSIVPDIFG